MLNEIRQEDGQVRLRQFLQEFQNVYTEERPAGGAAFSGARVRHNVDQTIANNVGVTLAFNLEDYDTDTYHDTVSNNSRLTAPDDGYYYIFATVQWTASVVGRRNLIINHNIDGGIAVNRAEPVSDVGVSTTHEVSTAWFMQAGEYVTLQVFQSSGGNLTVIAANSFSPVLGMHKLG